MAGGSGGVRDASETAAARHKECEPNDGSGKAKDATSTAAAVDFSEIYSELEMYKRENGGDLSIPRTHSSLGRIVDGLSARGVESLAKERWEDQFRALKKYVDDGLYEGHDLQNVTSFKWTTTAQSSKLLHTV